MDRDAKWARNWLENWYPLTIIRDRYTGSYSGGDYLAFPLHDYPAESQAGDTEARDFWSRNNSKRPYPIGMGPSPEEAHAALAGLMRAKALGAT